MPIPATVTIALGCMFLSGRVTDTTVGAPEPAVSAEDLGRGRIVIRIESADGSRVDTYRIGITKRHSPAAGPTERLQQWAAWGLGAFVCFNTNQFTGKEHCHTKDPKVYDPVVVDADGWVRAIRAAGMRYAVLTTRHTSGFLLWDSKTTAFDVGSGGHEGDVVKAFVVACREQGVAPGLYYCMWGGKKYRPTRGARALILAQLYELAKRYGKIPYFWIDMMNWAPDDLSAQEVYDVLRSLQPSTVVILNQHVQDGTKIRYFPTDVVNGELVVPPLEGHQPKRDVGGVSYYLPFEYCLCSQRRNGGITYDPLGPSCWFTYGAGRAFEPSEPFSAEDIAGRVRLARQRGASNVLLSVAPDHTGKMRPVDTRMLKQLGELLQSRSGSRQRGRARPGDLRGARARGLADWRSACSPLHCR
jgi:alpha-L-fucosidase